MDFRTGRHQAQCGPHRAGAAHPTIERWVIPTAVKTFSVSAGPCHGYKLQADHKLVLGDKARLLEILRYHCLIIVLR